MRDAVDENGPSHPQFVGRPKAPAAILSSIECAYLLSDICHPCSIQAIDCFSELKTILQSVLLILLFLSPDRSAPHPSAPDANRHESHHRVPRFSRQCLVPETQTRGIWVERQDSQGRRCRIGGTDCCGGYRLCHQGRSLGVNHSVAPKPLTPTKPFNLSLPLSCFVFRNRSSVLSFSGSAFYNFCFRTGFIDIEFSLPFITSHLFCSVLVFHNFSSVQTLSFITSLLFSSLLFSSCLS